MKTVYVKPYKMSSNGAKQVQAALGLLGVKCLRSRKRGIEWGIPTNKLRNLQKFLFAGVPSPEYTTIPEEAKAWLETGPVIARKLLSSHGGKGAVFMGTPVDFIAAPLYTKYIKKYQEFRVHVFNGKVLLVQEKRKRKGTNPDYRIRNHGDWVFCNKDIVEPEGLRKVGQDAVAAVGLLYGAVDIAYNAFHKQCYALEVNSAPGLSPSTALLYAQAIKEYVNAC